MPRKKKPDSEFYMAINGHDLTGEKRNGRWKFTCPSFPDLAMLTDRDIVITSFVQRVLAMATKPVQNRRQT